MKTYKGEDFDRIMVKLDNENFDTDKELKEITHEIMTVVAQTKQFKRAIDALTKRLLTTAMAGGDVSRQLAAVYSMGLVAGVLWEKETAQTSKAVEELERMIQ
jgi:septal ring factor EnvC (AmiA/AmiB activator)